MGAARDSVSFIPAPHVGQIITGPSTVLEKLDFDKQDTSHLGILCLQNKRKRLIWQS